MVGPVAWAKANLFATWFSTAVTLLIGYILIRVAIGFAEWAVFKAVWSVPYSPTGVANTAVCQNTKGDGACWAIIGDKFRLIMFGRFPYAEQWRTAIVVLLFIGLYGFSAIKSVWRKGLDSAPLRYILAAGIALMVRAKRA